MASVSAHVDAEPEAVWDVLADGWRFASWIVGCARVRAVDPAWPAPGARAVHAFGVWPVTLPDRTTVVDASAPHHLAMTSRTPVAASDITVDLAPDAGGSRVTITEELAGGPRFLARSTVTEQIVRWRNRQALLRLAALVERPAVPLD